MSKYILLVALFFLCVMLIGPLPAYADHCGETTTTTATSNIPEQATVPNTQSTSSMDSATTERSNDTFVISPNDLDVEGKLTLEAEDQLYRDVFNKDQLKHDQDMREYRDKLHKEVSAALNDSQKLELNKASGTYLPPNRDGADFLPGFTSGVSVYEKNTPKDDWDFLPDFIPGVSVYENMPKAPVTPEVVPTPSKGPAPAGEKSSRTTDRLEGGKASNKAFWDGFYHDKPAGGSNATDASGKDSSAPEKSDTSGSTQKDNFGSDIPWQ